MHVAQEVVLRLAGAAVVKRVQRGNMLAGPVVGRVLAACVVVQEVLCLFAVLRFPGFGVCLSMHVP